MKITLLKGDITKVPADAIVNAANSRLMGGGGVDGAIHLSGGPMILKECRQIYAEQGECPPGEAVVTTAGELPAEHVIHTVGPVWHGGNSGERETLANCYLNSLKLASELNCNTVSFPNISTGAYGFPKEEAANIAIRTVSEGDFPAIEQVIFVCFDEENYKLYQERMHRTWANG